MPKSASYHLSPKSATFVRALTTWLPAAQLNHSSHHQVLRENSFPWREMKSSTVTWQCLTIVPIKQEIRKHSCRESTVGWQVGTCDPLSSFEATFGTTSGWKKRAKKLRVSLLIVLVIFYNTQEDCCIIALRTLSKCLNRCCSLRGFRTAVFKSHLTDYFWLFFFFNWILWHCVKLIGSLPLFLFFA